MADDADLYNSLEQLYILPGSIDRPQAGEEGISTERALDLFGKSSSELDALEAIVGTMDGRFGTIAGRFRQRTDQIFREAEPALTRLMSMAALLKMRETEGALTASYQGLRRPEFRMIMLGRFKNGKSTLLNSLLGRLEHSLSDLPDMRGAPLPVDEQPATPRLTTIRYSDSPELIVVFRDGRREVRSLKWFLENATLKPDEDANAAAFGDVLEFELRYPFESGRAGIVFIDSPGTDEATERNAITVRALNNADAAIVMLRTDALASRGEAEFIEEMRSVGLATFFTVVNRMNGRPVDEKLRQNVWERWIRRLHGGPAYAGQELTTNRVLFVDARSALEARLAGDPAAAEASGLLEFERVLAEFYERERRAVHVRRWVDLADVQAGAILEFLDRAVPALTQKREEFLQRYEELKPRLTELARRKEKIPNLFETFGDRCVAKLLAGFEDLVRQIRDDLPAIMEKAELPSLQGVRGTMWAAVSPKTQRAAAEEAIKLAQAFIKARVDEWATTRPPQPGACQILEPLFERFVEDLRTEVQRTELEFAQLHFDLSGYGADRINAGASESNGTWWTRIIPAAAGMAFGPDLAALGYGNKWRGFGKGLVVHLGVFTALTTLSGPFGWTTLAAGWLVTFAIRALWQRSDLETEIKRKVVQGLVYGGEDPDTKQQFEGLLGEVKNVRPRVEQAVRDMLKAFNESTSKAFAAEIDQQIDHVEGLRKQSELAREQKLKILESYKKARIELKQCLETLAKVKLMGAPEGNVTTNLDMDRSALVTVHT